MFIDRSLVIRGMILQVFLQGSWRARSSTIRSSQPCSRTPTALLAVRPRSCWGEGGWRNGSCRGVRWRCAFRSSCCHWANDLLPWDLTMYIFISIYYIYVIMWIYIYVYTYMIWWIFVGFNGVLYSSLINKVYLAKLVYMGLCSDCSDSVWFMVDNWIVAL